MAATQAKGATPTDLGYLVSFFNFISDFGLVLFNVYTYCYFDDLLQFFGKITGSQAAAGNYLNNILFTVYGYYTQSSSNPPYLASQSIQSQTQATNYTAIGYYLG